MDAALEKTLREAIFKEVKTRVGQSAESLDDKKNAQIIKQVTKELTASLTSSQCSPEDRQRIADDLENEFLRLGPLEPLLAEDEITEIMVNGGGRNPVTGKKYPPVVFVEVHGQLQKVSETLFTDDEHLYRIIGQIGRKIGRSCTSAHPIMDARLEDGSRVLAVHGDVAPDGPSLTIRKFRKDVMTPDVLVRSGSCTPQMMQFLQSCVAARINIFVSGGTGSGKTTFLNVLSQFIPNNERIITIENPIELQLNQPNLVRWEARPANTEGEGEVTIHDLLVAALRARPDRIVVGEVRSIETIDMLQAMTTGHDGSLSTVHANDPLTAFSRLRTMVQESNPNMSIEAIDSMVASAIDLIVHVERDGYGHRHVSQIVSVDGYSDGVITHSDLFEFDPVEGVHKANGLQPHKIHERIVKARKPYDPNWFLPEGGLF